MALNFITDPVPEYSYEEELENQTLISQFANRAEQRRASWSQSYKLFTLRYNIKTREEINRLWNFYQLCRGSFKTFNYQKPFPMLPNDQVTAWWPLHEGEGTKIDDWNGFIYPTYSCRFMEDRLSYEEFSVRIQKTGLKLYQVLPVIFTNNYGTLSGGVSWIQCPDGSAGISFDGIDGQVSMGDAPALDVGTGDFSIALALYTNSLSAQLGILSKKVSGASGNKGYHLLISTAGTITFVFSDGTTQKTLTSAAGAISNQTWKIIVVTIDRDGNGQIYVNNAASGSPVAIGASNNADNATNFYIGRAEGVAYGNFRARNGLFAKKVWAQTERDLIWNTWKGIFQI
jgi:hypothetical protein